MPAINLSALSLEDRRHFLWTQGSLRHLCRPYQLPIYDAFHAWYETKSDPEIIRANQEKGAKFHNMMAWSFARQIGKTSLALILAVEFMIRRPGATGIITTSTKEQINPIILKALSSVFEGKAPPGYMPEFHTREGGMSNVLTLPATGSEARLVGLDLHSKRLRGTFLDYFICTEVSYCSYDIGDIYRAVIAPQFRARPWSWSLFESSYAESEHHPHHALFAADAAKRGAYHERTIGEIGLSPREIREAEDMMGGPGTAIVLRELWNIHAIDKERAVCASMTSANVIKPDQWEPPKHALCVVGLDPGNTDMAGVVFLVVEPSKRIATVVSSWGGTVTSTDDLVTIIRTRERELWGTKAETIVTEPKRPLHDILKAPREVPLQSVQIEQLSIDSPTYGGWYQIFDAPAGTCTWWDDEAKTLRPNPWVRVMDVSPQQRQDMRERHGLVFQQPGKAEDNKTLQIGLLNEHLHNGTLRIIDNEDNQQLLKQMRSGRWDERRKDFERSAQLGHLDIVEALAIACRMIHWDRDPRRPLHVEAHSVGYFTPTPLKKLMEPLRSKEKERRRIDHKRYR